MIDRTELDLRYAAHDARTDRVNREGWKTSPAPPATPQRSRRSPARGGANIHHLTFQFRDWLPTPLRRAAV
jgi:hypothetical protein